MFQVVDLFLFSTSLGLNGSGCPPGSVIYTLSSQCSVLYLRIYK